MQTAVKRVAPTLNNKKNLEKLKIIFSNSPKTEVSGQSNNHKFKERELPKGETGPEHLLK